MNVKDYLSSELIELYVLGLTDDVQTAEINQLRKNNLELDAQILETENLFETLDHNLAVAPPIELKNAIWEKIKEAETPSESINAIQKPSNTPSKLSVEKIEKPSKYKFWAVAASVVLFASLGTNLVLLNKATEQENAIQNVESKSSELASQLTSLQKDMEIQSNANMKKIMLKGVGTHTDALAKVMWDTQTKKVYLDASALPKANENQQYQLWALVDGKPVDAGMFDANSLRKMQDMKVIEKAQAFAITLEKKGGSPTPTMEAMYVMGEV